MAEQLLIADGGKTEKYQLLCEQIKALVDVESDIIANMANISSMIHETFALLWTGFYRVVGEELVLGPFQGPLACTRIRRGKGVCGTAWTERRTLVVADVEAFPGHIACSSLSKSEIVVPLFAGDEVIGVLDIDSAELSTFDEIDAHWLEKIVGMLAAHRPEIKSHLGEIEVACRFLIKKDENFSCLKLLIDRVIGWSVTNGLKII